MGWLFEDGNGEHIDFDPVPDTRTVAEGETFRFRINKDKLFPVADKKSGIKQPSITIPLTQDTSGPRDDRPTHVVCLMLENRSFDHLLGKVQLPAGHPGWHRRTDLPDAKPVVWPDPDHDVDGVQHVQVDFVVVVAVVD